MGIILLRFDGCIATFLQWRIYFDFSIRNVDVYIDLVALTVGSEGSLHCRIPFIHAYHLYALLLRHFSVLLVQ